MKRKILALLLVAAMLVSVFASCTNGNGGETQDECTHTFSDAWSSDAENHWHAATCEHGENKGDLAPHTDADEDGKCDVCAYDKGHTHTYATEWSSDETKHWHAATCTHTAEKSDEALHADEDTNGECDVCAAHVHTVDDTGFCTGCNQQVGTVDENDLAALMAAILAGYNKVLSGSVDYTNTIVGSETLTLTHKVDYVLSTDGIYMKRTEPTTVYETWSKLNGEDVESVLVETADGTVVNAEPNMASAESLTGYYFAVSTLVDGYGAENILNAIYTLATTENAANKIDGYTVAIDAENNKGELSFNILTINSDTAEGEGDNVNYYSVSVDFTYSEDFVLTALNIKCDCYTNSLDNEAENDYTYDQATQTITMKDTATADTYTFTVAQTAGEKTTIDMSVAGQYAPESFEIYASNDMENALTEITLPVVFNPADPWPDVAIVCPEGTFVKFVSDALQITVTDKSGAATAGLSAILTGDVIQLLPVVVGEYVVTLTLGEFTKTINVTVEGKTIEVGELNFKVNTTDTYCFVDLYTFTATESGTYTFILPAGLGLYSEEKMDANAMPEVDFYNNAEGGAKVSVALAAGATFNYYVGATIKAEWTISYEFNAHDVEVEDDDEQGGQTGSGAIVVGTNNVIFTAEEIEADLADRTFVATVTGRYELKDSGVFYTFKDSAGNTVAKVEYKYVDLVAGETYTVQFSMLKMFSIQAGKTYTLTVIAPEGGEDGGEESGVVTGTYTGTNLWGDSPLTVTVTENEVTFVYVHPFQGESTATYKYEIVDGAVVLYDEDGNVLNPLAGLVTIDENGTPVSADFNGTSYTLSAGGNGGGSGSGGNTGDGEGNGIGTEDDPYEITLPATDLMVNGDSTNYFWVVVTTTDAGIITVNYPNANSMVRIINANDAEDSAFLFSKQTITFKAKANSTYKIGLGVWDAEEGLTASISFKVSEGPELADKGAMESEGETTFSVTSDDIALGAFNATLYTGDAGEYNIFSSDLFVTSVTNAAGETVSRNDNGYYELDSYSEYTVTVSVQYVSGAGSYALTVEYQYPQGHQKNPHWLFGLGEETTATYKGDYQVVWYSFYAEEDGIVTVKVGDKNVTVMITAVPGMEISNDVDGQWVDSVSLPVMKGRQYFIGAVHSQWSEETYEMKFATKFEAASFNTEGNPNVPHKLQLSEGQVVRIPEWETLYYAYTATANGTLTITTPGGNYFWGVATEFGDIEFTTDKTISVHMEIGQIAYFAISTADGNEDKVEYSVTFDADPVEVYFEGEIIVDGSAPNKIKIENNTWAALCFYSNGKFTVSWNNPSAKVEFVSWGAPNTPLANGDVIEGSSWGTDLKIYFADYAAGELELTITPYVAETTSGLVVGDNTLTIKDTNAGDSVALPVNADKAVTYVITVGANGVVVTAGGDVLFEGKTLEVTVPAGETVTVTVGSYSWSDPVAHISVAVKEDSGNQGGSQGGSGNAETTTLKFVVPTPTSMFINSEVQKVEIAASGKYIISATGYDNIQNTRLQYYDAASDTWVTIARTPGHDTHVIPYGIELSAGDVLQIRLQCWNAADAGTDIVVTVAPAA